MADEQNNRTSIWMCILYFFLIAFLVIVFSCLVAFFTLLVLIPYYTMPSATSQSSPISYTNVWSLTFATTHNSTESFPKDFDELARSFDRIMQIDFPSTVIKSAYFTTHLDGPTVKMEIQTVYLYVQLQLQYPPQCRGIRECEDIFRYRTLAKFFETRTHPLSVLLRNGKRVYLEIQLEQIDEKTRISENHLIEEALRQSQSRVDAHSCSGDQRRTSTDST